MTPLFGPKPARPGVAFGPGYGEHQAGAWSGAHDYGWSPPRWQAGPWQAAPWQGGSWRGAAHWPRAALDSYGQFQPWRDQAPGGFGGLWR